MFGGREVAAAENSCQVRCPGKGSGTGNWWEEISSAVVAPTDLSFTPKFEGITQGLSRVRFGRRRTAGRKPGKMERHVPIGAVPHRLHRKTNNGPWITPGHGVAAWAALTDFNCEKKNTNRRGDTKIPRLDSANPRASLGFGAAP